MGARLLTHRRAALLALVVGSLLVGLCLSSDGASAVARTRAGAGASAQPARELARACPRGSWAESWTCATCPPDSVSTGARRCTRCAAGFSARAGALECTPTVAHEALDVGRTREHWRLAGGGAFAVRGLNGTTVVCSSLGRCLADGSCKAGYFGFACSRCAWGYHRDAGECAPCTGWSRNHIWIYGGVFATILATVGAGSESGLMRSSFPLAMGYAQLLGLVHSYDLRFGPELRATLRASSVVFGNSEVLALDCHLRSYGFFSDWSISVLGGTMFAGVCVFGAGLARVLVERIARRRRQLGGETRIGGGVRPQRDSRSVRAVLVRLFDEWRWIVIAIFHPWIVLRASTVFRCDYIASDNTWRMTRFPWVECYTQTWRGYAFASAFVLLATVVILPGWMIWLLWFQRRRVLDKRFAARYGALYLRYRPGAYTWELANFFARALIGLAPAMPASSVVYVWGAAQVSMIVMVALALLWPMLRWQDTPLELFSFGTAFMLLVSSTVISADPSESELSVLSHALLALVVLTACIHCANLFRSAVFFMRHYSTFSMPIERRADERLLVRRAIAPQLYRYLGELHADERAVLAAACSTMQAVRERNAARA